VSCLTTEIQCIDISDEPPVKQDISMEIMRAKARFQGSGSGWLLRLGH
jgi:hypothetical protein